MSILPLQRKGVAQGGPLHNIVITACADWNGFVQKDNTGRYRWNVLTSRWDWVDRVIPVDQSLTKPKRTKKSRRKNVGTSSGS